MGQFWNLSQYRPYRLGLLGAGHSYQSERKEKRVRNIKGLILRQEVEGRGERRRRIGLQYYEPRTL